MPVVDCEKILNRAGVETTLLDNLVAWDLLVKAIRVLLVIILLVVICVAIWIIVVVNYHVPKIISVKSAGEFELLRKLQVIVAILTFQSLRIHVYMISFFKWSLLDLILLFDIFICPTRVLVIGQGGGVWCNTLMTTYALLVIREDTIGALGLTPFFKELRYGHLVISLRHLEITIYIAACLEICGDKTRRSEGIICYARVIVHELCKFGKRWGIYTAST